MPDATGRDRPGRLAEWMQPFRAAFTAPTWQYVMVLVTGAILGVVQNLPFLGHTESRQSRASQGIPRFACNPDLNHALGVATTSAYYEPLPQPGQHPTAGRRGLSGLQSVASERYAQYEVLASRTAAASTPEP